MKGRSVLILTFVLSFALLALTQPQEAQVVRIARVVDGDTVVLLGSHEHVRYLGIDTPEAGEPFYYVAGKVNRDLVLGRDVYLEFGQQRRDAYGRLLAYLWVEREDEWILVNEELLRKGVARLYVFWPKEEKYYDRFLRAVTLAQVEKRALWSKYKQPLALGTVEDDPVPYIAEAVTVEFSVGRVEPTETGWTVWAEGSRYGFHVDVSQEVWGRLGLFPEELVGKKLSVTGELRWDSLFCGPSISVIIPEQWGRSEEQPAGRSDRI